MKRKMKHMAGMLALLTSICLLAGCAGRADVFSAPDVGSVTGITEIRPDVDAAGSLEDGECPEGYVYDYQVSMEPIPEEIAALGGPCEGTIHAFPSRIGMALTELEMEKDPVLKAEVEKRIPEIEAALEEEIGGEFVVDGVILLDDLRWVFFCNEVETGYGFDLYYSNDEYYSDKRGERTIGNLVSVNYYYDEKKSITLRDDLIPITEKIFAAGDIKIRFRSEVNVVDIIIAEYVDSEVDKCHEQEKILLLWDALQSYNDTIDYNLNVTFYPSRYRDIIREKNSTVFRYDLGRIYSEETVACLTEREEIWCCFSYSGFWDGEDVNNLDALLQKYKDGGYEPEEIWDYWIP